MTGFWSLIHIAATEWQRRGFDSATVPHHALKCAKKRKTCGKKDTAHVPHCGRAI
jgi:hypothetical protein